MSIVIQVSKKEEPHLLREYEFDQEKIIIGRDPKSNIPLKTEKNTVSRSHALIKKFGKTYKISDCNSRNATYLNNEKLIYGQEYDIAEGDQITICDYMIVFSFPKRVIISSHEEKTIIGEPNPFIELSKELSSAVLKLGECFQAVDINRKQEALQEALHDAFDSLEDRSALLSVFQHLCSEMQKEPGTSTKVPTSGEREKTPRIEKNIISIEERKNYIFELLLKFLGTMIQFRRQFQQEFINETIIAGSGMNSEKLKDFLLDRTVDLEELKKRLELIKATIEEMGLHQVALLEGYKTSIRESIHQIIDRFDPKELRKKVQSNSIDLIGVKIPVEFLPFLESKKIVELLSQMYSELCNEDQSVIENSYFIPNFIKGYSKIMNNSRGTQQKPKDSA